MAKMGLQFGLNDNGKFCKRSNRWLFKIPKVSADDSPGVNSLPPSQSARPSVSFKEMLALHLNEDIYYPAKPDWKPVTLTLYDLQLGSNPVFDWIKQVYDPQAGKFYPPNSKELIKVATLELYNGCGDLVETWTYEDAWPQSVNFQNLDMAQANILTCEITVRYARAYVA